MKRIEKILSSPRFHLHRNNLLEETQVDGFTGTWVCQGKIDAKQPPASSDIVLLFFHGGGYVLGDLAMYLSTLLCIADTISGQNLSVSILFLEYSLAPEHPFPKQLEQARAAYHHLTHDLAIDVNKIGLLGDSAGGNLVLSLLTSIQAPPRNTGRPVTKFVKPSLGAFMFSPWISPGHLDSSWNQKALTDILTKTALNRWAKYFKHGSRYEPHMISFYTDFSRPEPTRPSLSTILPPRVWLTAGSDELFEADIRCFASSARNDRIDVELTISPGKVHDWQISQAEEQEDAWIATDKASPADDLMTGAKEIAGAIVEATSRAKTSRD